MIRPVREEIAGLGDVTISLPRLLGGQGVLTTLMPSLDEHEHAALKAGAAIIRGAIDSLG
jgi:L-lactate dehydrogenase